MWHSASTTWIKLDYSEKILDITYISKEEKTKSGSKETKNMLGICREVTRTEVTS